MSTKQAALQSCKGLIHPSRARMAFALIDELSSSPATHSIPEGPYILGSAYLCFWCALGGSGLEGG